MTVGHHSFVSPWAQVCARWHLRKLSLSPVYGGQAPRTGGSRLSPCQPGRMPHKAGSCGPRGWQCIPQSWPGPQGHSTILAEEDMCGCPVCCQAWLVGCPPHLEMLPRVSSEPVICRAEPLTHEQCVNNWRPHPFLPPLPPGTTHTPSSWDHPHPFLSGPPTPPPPRTTRPGAGHGF